MFSFFIQICKHLFFQRLFILIVVLLIPLFPAQAIGISPPKIDFGSVGKWNVSTGEITVVRNGSTEPTGNIVMYVQARGKGSDFFSGNSSLVIPDGSGSVLYTFTIIPNNSAQGNNEVQIDFLVQNTDTINAGVGSTIITGATAAVQFSLPNEGGGSSSGSSVVILPNIEKKIETQIEIPKIIEVPVKIENKKEVVLEKNILKTVIKEKKISKSKVATKPTTFVFDEHIKAPEVFSPSHSEPIKFYSNNNVDLVLENKNTTAVSAGYLFSITQKSIASIQELTQTTTTPTINLQLPDGIYYVHVAEIIGEKVSPISTRRILIDTTPPVISEPILREEPHVFLKSKFALDISAQDKTTSVAYFRITTPTDTYVSVMDNIPLKHLKKGTYPVTVEAVDIVGNAKTEQFVLNVVPETEWETVTRLFKTLTDWWNK